MAKVVPVLLLRHCGQSGHPVLATVTMETCKMCDCEESNRNLGERISGLVDALKVGHDGEDYEGSEPLSFGGPQGLYALRSPFNGPCQFKVDTMSAGSTLGVAVVGRTRVVNTPGLAATDPPTGELGPINGLVLTCQGPNTIPVDSEWYDVVDSSNAIFAVITSTTALYMTIKFRQKR